MATTVSLGKDYTVSGLTGTTELTVTYSAEGVDTTTRFGAPIKRVKSGIPDYTFEGTVLGTSTNTFVIGQGYTLTLNGGAAKDVICMNVSREEPGDGTVSFKLTMKPGVASETANQVTVGSGTYKA